MRDGRETASDAVHEALPASLRVGLPSYHQERGDWTVSAVNERSTGRRKRAEAFTGTGETEIAALRDLDDRLRGVPPPDGTAIYRMRGRLRLSYVQGAGDWTQRELGRPMSGEELERVAKRYDER
jgi:hypothetical protein